MQALGLHTHHWEPATSSSAVTLLLLHGTGGNESDLLSLGRLVAPGAALLSPRGNVLEQGAPRFFRRLAEGIFDLEDLHRRTGELADFVDAASVEYGFAASRLYAVGFSNGANIAASMLLSRPETMAGAVLLRAMVPFEPAEPAQLAAKAVLLSEGNLDPLVTPATAKRLMGILQDGGAEVELVWQNASHGLTQGDVTSASRWLAARLPTRD